MTMRIFTLLLLISFATPSFASKKTSTTPPATAATSSGHHSTPMRLSLSPSLFIISSTLGFGLGATFTFHMQKPVPFWLGLETGFYTASTSTSSGTFAASTRLNNFPILGTAIYHFDIASLPFRPYAGLSLGLGIVSGRATVATVSGGSSSVEFQFLVRPGVEGHLNDKLNWHAEAKFGSLGGSFVFIPQAGVIFSL